MHYNLISKLLLFIPSLSLISLSIPVSCLLSNQLYQSATPESKLSSLRIIIIIIIDDDQRRSITSIDRDVKVKLSV